MRKIILTAAGIALLTSVGMGYAVDAKTPEYSDNTPVIEHVQVANEVEGIYNFEEYNVVAELVQLDKLNPQIVEDNKKKRVILFANDAGRPQYKSIYMKSQKHLKIVDFKGGLVFSQVLDKDKVNDFIVDESTPPKQEISNNSITGLTEYTKLASAIDLNIYSAEITEDNKGKRVILLKNENNQPRYKSIYTKNNGYLKIIDMRGGLLFNGKI